MWYDGKEDKSRPTDPTLPTGENLNGSHAYSLIMPYFTTNDMKPSEVHELGKKQLDELYPLVCTILQIFKWKFLLTFLSFKSRDY